MVLIPWPCNLAFTSPTWPILTHTLLLLAGWVVGGAGMTDEAIATLRQDTRNLFYHGYSNYLTHAFPEDELKPLSCQPQTRNRENPADIGLNDVLGNYSLTLIDSLSTLAMLASDEGEKDGHNARQDFHSGVKALVELYGNGTKGSCGSRACGFDLDSKVQVFETNIRGLGGLLSAHLFAIGELPMRGYTPVWVKQPDDSLAVDWNGWIYHGQLLGLAQDLATRLLPAFSTSTGLPYPRVNLRTGIPFYQEAREGMCLPDGTTSENREITETCAAGSGSLVLEFTTLSRLTGVPLFEILAKKAFWSVWDRRSSIDLVGGGIDAESGQWIVPPLAGVGAGIDSFYEYALKSHILLSNLPYDPSRIEDDPSDNFLLVWQQAHAAVKRHIYRNKRTEKHPYYGQVDMDSGAPRYNWIDNLSAYYPGLLTLAGELDEAIESHLLYAALWTRYSAIPERWQAFNAHIDPNFKHWAGRPEFIESTYYLYQATKDPFYLHVGEMALRDIRRRCWTKCGWADLGDVISGEQRDRMESFFLGETAKYLYLLFEPSHPMNHLDAPVVFTTEGHPLTIPKSHRRAPDKKTREAIREHERELPQSQAFCQIAPSPLPLTVSNIANRDDLFHAAAMATLHLAAYQPAQASPILEASDLGPGISLLDVTSPTNYSFYPWTLPQDLTPVNGFSSRIRPAMVSTLSFPNLNQGPAIGGDKDSIPFGALQKVVEGVVINSLSNVRLNMVEEAKTLVVPTTDGSLIEMEVSKEYRIHGIANWALGRDEKVILSSEAMRSINPIDPHFTRIKDLEMVDLVIDVPIDEASTNAPSVGADVDVMAPNNTLVAESLWSDLEAMVTSLLGGAIPSATRGAATSNPTLTREIIPAILPTGVGAAPLSERMDDAADPLSIILGALPYSGILFLDDTLCTHLLPPDIAKSYPILVLARGGCSFNDKLANIPAFAPLPDALQLVVMISVAEADYEPDDRDDLASPGLIRPLLDSPQLTPNGFERRHPLSMVMVDGSAETIATLRRSAARIAAFDAHGVLVDLWSREDGAASSKKDRPGLAVKRRFWFESLGVPIKNLVML